MLSSDLFLRIALKIFEQFINEPNSNILECVSFSINLKVGWVSSYVVNCIDISWVLMTATHIFSDTKKMLFRSLSIWFLEGEPCLCHSYCGNTAFEDWLNSLCKFMLLWKWCKCYGTCPPGSCLVGAYLDLTPMWPTLCWKDEGGGFQTFIPTAIHPPHTHPTTVKLGIPHIFKVCWVGW